MSMRMTSTAFLHVQNNFPGQMTRLEMEVASFNMFRYRRIRKKKKKTNVERYGEELAAILKWLDENVSEPYYPRKVTDQKLCWDTKIEFFFIEESDAMAFKLCFS